MATRLFNFLRRKKDGKKREGPHLKKKEECPEVKKKECPDIKKTECSDVKKIESPDVKKNESPDVKRNECPPDEKKIECSDVKKTECSDVKKNEYSNGKAEAGISENTMQLYITAEFKSLGDITHDNHLRFEEFVRLMLLLGYPRDEEEAKKIWNSVGLPDGGFMALGDYVALMSNEEVSSRTDTWRKLFAEFDTNGNGYASKAEVLHGLHELGIDLTPKIRGKVEGMDGDKDGKISYGEFLKAQLSQE